MLVAALKPQFGGNPFLLEGVGQIRYEEVEKKIRPIQIPQPNQSWDARKIREFIDNITAGLPGLMLMDIEASAFAVIVDKQQLMLYPLAQKYGISDNIINFQETINLLNRGYFFKATAYN
jgi:hypothetical protein